MCLEESFLYFQLGKSYSRKTKTGTIFSSFWKTHLRVLCKKHSHLILIGGTNSFHITDTVQYVI